MPPQADSSEKRVRNATGGEKGVKAQRFDLIPPNVLWQVAEHFGKGAEKYAPRNWEQGCDWSLWFSAMQRHAWQFWGGEDIDPETGTRHLCAVIFHAMCLLESMDTHPELDDRSRHGPEPAGS